MCFNKMIRVLFLFFFMSNANSLNASEKCQIPKIPIIDYFSFYCDSRISSIMSNPAYFTMLDQKEIFKEQSLFNMVIEKSTMVPLDILQDLFQPKENMTFSVCPGDARIYFFTSKNDYLVIGWLPIILPNIQYIDITSGDSMVFWLIQKPGKKSAIFNFGKKIDFNSLGQNYLDFKKSFSEKLRIDITKGPQNDHVFELKSSMTSKYGIHRIDLTVASTIIEMKVQIITDTIKSQSISIQDSISWVKWGKSKTLDFIWPPLKQ